MALKNLIEVWNNEGSEPDLERKEKGFEGGYYPPSGIFNWLFNQQSGAIKELQELFKSDNLPIEWGGTGAKTASGAVKNLLSKELISADNLKNADKLVDSGFYRCYFDSADTPPENYNFPSKYGVMLVVASSSYMAQLFFDVLNSVSYFRASSNSGSTWKAWKRVLSDNETGSKGQVLGFKDTNTVGAMTLAAVDIGALPNKTSAYTGDVNEITDGLWKLTVTATNTPTDGTAGVILHRTWDSNFAIQLFFPAQDKMYRRVKSHGEWSNWVVAYDEVTMPTPKDYMFQELIKADNLKASESLKSVGTYQIYLEDISPAEYNYPNNYGLLTVERGTSYFRQTFYDAVGKCIYYRSSVDTGTTWTDWKKCATIADVNTVSIPVSWAEDTTNGGYKQSVTVNGITASDNPIVDVVLGSNAATNKAYLKAWGCVDRITTGANSITLYAYSKAPETAFNIQLKVVR